MQSWPRKLVSHGLHLLSVSFVLIIAITCTPLVTALLNVTSMYHDTLVTKMIQSDTAYKPLIPSSHHTRFTRAWADRSNQYKWAARILELIRFTELLIEMGLRRKFSAKTRWRGIMLIEVIKLAAIFQFLQVRLKSFCHNQSISTLGSVETHTASIALSPDS